MARTILSVMKKLILDLHEQTIEFPSGLWSQEEMFGYINFAERDFLRQATIQWTDHSQIADGTTRVFARPADAIGLRRIAFNGKRLWNTTAWQLAREDPSWRNSSGEPSQWYYDQLEPVDFAIDKVPIRPGILRIFYFKAPTPVNSMLDTLSVRDHWEPYIRWKVLNLAWGKDGDGQDLARSGYCNKRFMFGVFLAARLMTALDRSPGQGRD